MSSIEKLLIRGIRSFSPDSQNVIEFYSPVTIIVGHNGAGKTTIIECLKYATTGDLPPNAKGGAFVHDPKLSADNEVKAQIRLKFKNVRGQTMVVTRSMQSTLKKNNKLEQKSLEGLLVTTDPNTGEQVSISTRCAELDAEIPLHLGVSKAVLENVIFCHQEDSFWPLSEPSVLKKKFDDIFAATRYTKALETIKSLRKELTAELKLENQKLEYLKADQEKSVKIEATLAATERRMEETREKVASLDLQIANVNANIDRLSEDLQSLSSLLNEVERLQHDLQVTNQSMQDLSSTMKPMSESDAQLRSMLEELLVSVRGAEMGLTELEKRKAEAIGQIEVLTRDYSLRCTRKGALEAECAEYERKLVDRQQMLLKVASLFNLVVGEHVFSSSGGMEAVAKLMEEVRLKLNAQRDRIAGIKSETAAQDSFRMQQIQVAMLRHSSLEESRRMKRKLVEDYKASKMKLEDEITAISSPDAVEAMNDCQRQLEEDEQLLAMVKAQFCRADYERKLDVLSQNRRTTETEIDRIQAQLQKATQMADSMARLDMKMTEKLRKEDIFSKSWMELKADLTPLIDSLHGCNSIEESERAFDSWQRGRASRSKSSQEAAEQAQRQLSVLSSRLELGRALLARKEADLKEKSKSIEELCEGGSFLALLEQTEEELASVTANITMLQSSSTMFEAFLGQLSRTHECPLCERGFDEFNSEMALQTKLKSTMKDKSALQLSELSAKKAELEKKLNSLHSLRPVQSDIDRLRLQELPELWAELQTVENDQVRLENEAMEAQEVASTAQSEEKRSVIFRRRFDDALRLGRELKGLQLECDRLSQEIGLVGVCGTAAELQTTLSSLQGTARTMASEMEAIQVDLRRKENELQLRENRVHDCREQLMQRQLQQADLSRIRAQALEIEEAIRKCNEEIYKIGEELEVAAKPLAELRAERETWLVMANEREMAARSALEESQSFVAQLQSLQSDITSRMDPNEELQELLNAVNACELAIQARQQELKHIQEEVSRQSKQAAEVQLLERSILDNLKHRELATRCEQTESKLSSLQDRLGGIDRSHLQSQQSRAHMKQSDIMGERSGLLGELRQLEDQAGRLRQELVTDYPEVAKNYQNQLVRVQAISLGSDDLDKYARALDQAIMKYHALKMDEINDIIREIWQTTYQGADIDSVEIRADHEASGATGAVGARSYNYRVVMIKGNTELDMRGRSSAGQRVLTSLIIRLALAETFGLHCGILALDEPTTNLDRDNISGLAQALASIIRGRRAQTNFQLLVITHDEEFVQLLGHFECAEYYWRVFKDENQHSCIERQSIQGILE